MDNINSKIRAFLSEFAEYTRPKHYYEMLISLEGYNKEIQRKISVDSNVSLENFCKSVIVSMQGDLSHLYGIKIGKDYIDEEILEALEVYARYLME